MTTPDRYLSLLSAAPWAILPGKLNEIRAAIALRASGHGLTEKELQAAFGAGAERQAAAGRARHTGVTAVLPVFGTILPRASLMSAYSGGTSCQALMSGLRTLAADHQVGRIVLEIDSPGGSVDLVPELAALIREIRKDKPIIGVANCLAASAAYWIMAQCSEAVVTPSGECGSVGVYQLHVDQSEALKMEGLAPTFIHAGRLKVEGNPFEPLSDDARSRMQADVDRYHALFLADVAKGRGVSVAKVRTDFGEGRCMGPQAALAAGMIDRIATLEDVISGRGASSTPAQRAARLAELAKDPAPAPGSARAEHEARVRRLQLLEKG